MTAQSTPAPGLPELPKLPDLLNRALEAVVLLQTIRCHPRRHDMERSWLTDADRVIGYWEKTRTAEAIRVHLSDLEAGRASRAQSEWEAGTEDADGNPLVTVRSDAVVALAEFALTPALTSIRVGDERLSRVELTNRLIDAVKCAAPATLGETK